MTKKTSLTTFSYSLKSRTSFFKKKQRYTPDKKSLISLVSQAGISLSPEQFDQLWVFHQLLRENNRDQDLTRIINFESMVRKHYIDCMIVGNWLSLPSPIADLGSGAGFPGIPLKIRYPQLQITLAEPKPSRIQFLLLAIKKMGLKKIEVFEHKVVSRSFQKPVKAIITRALESMDKTILRSSGCTEAGAKLIFMKGPNVEEEKKIVKQRFPVGLILKEDISYLLPGTEDERRLLVYEKTKEFSLPGK